MNKKTALIIAGLVVTGLAFAGNEELTDKDKPTEKPMAKDIRNDKSVCIYEDRIYSEGAVLTKDHFTLVCTKRPRITTVYNATGEPPKDLIWIMDLPKAK